MRNTNSSSSVTTASYRVNGRIVEVIGAVRSFLRLTVMREHLGYWWEHCQTFLKHDSKTCQGDQPSYQAQLIRPAACARALRLAPVAALPIRANGRRLG